MYARILKDSEASRKAWESRRSNAAKPFVIPSPKDRIVPTAKNKAKIAKMQTYMDGFSSKLKNANERAYVQERVQQMLSGTPRPSGMSGKHSMTKQRAVQYEALTHKIFIAGRTKNRI